MPPSHCEWRLLLPNFIKVSGGLQQIELRLLALEIRVEVGHPPIIFLQAGFFHLAHIDFGGGVGRVAAVGGS